MANDPTTEDLRREQSERLRRERRQAEEASDADAEVRQHERRAQRARYLAEKLEERAEAERRQ
jgi:hypothetical protein